MKNNNPFKMKFSWLLGLLFSIVYILSYMVIPFFSYSFFQIIFKIFFWVSIPINSFFNFILKMVILSRPDVLIISSIVLSLIGNLVTGFLLGWLINYIINKIKGVR
jgi:hypothetical protein